MTSKRWVTSAVVGALVATAAIPFAQEITLPDPEPEGSATVFPGRLPATGPTGAPEESHKRWNDPTLTPLEQIDAAIQARAKSGADRMPNCRFGPVERRISDERLQQMFQEFEKLPGEESWKLLQAEPDDPNSPPINIIIPADSGPNCPERDIDEVLLEERQQILNEQADELRVAASPTIESGTRSPISVHWHGKDRSELSRVEGIIRSRTAQGLSRLPDCYYGPVELRLPPDRMQELVELGGDLSGDEAWRLLLAEPQDSQAEPLTYIVRAGKKPDCPAGDIDERLRQERERLRDRQPRP